MKIEKISNNKIKIIMSIEELEKREISIEDLETDNNLAKKLLIDIIEENNLDEEFKLDESQLLIEASSDNENLFIVTITKLDLPECDITHLISNDKKYDIKNNNIFIFESINSVLDFCNVLKSINSDSHIGRNSLYKSNDKYILTFSKSSIKNKKFSKISSLLSEYSTPILDSDLLLSNISEKYSLIIKNSAIQKLIKI